MFFAYVYKLTNVQEANSIEYLYNYNINIYYGNLLECFYSKPFDWNLTKAMVLGSGENIRKNVLKCLQHAF